MDDIGSLEIRYVVATNEPIFSFTYSTNYMHHYVPFAITVSIAVSSR